MKTVLITGATSGIGKATAVKFAENNYRIIITGRRADKLNELATYLKSEFDIPVRPLCFDVSNQQDTQIYLSSLTEEWTNIDILINNAGLAAGFSGIQDGLLTDWDQMIDVNIKGLLYVTKIVVQNMISRKQGHIINIGSIAGKEAYPNGNVYCGTKHAVDAISKGMRMDLVQYGIKVSRVCPGMVDTEFSLVRFKGDQQKADAVYNGFTPLYAQDIADTIFFVASRPAHANIDDILVMPAAQASATFVHRENL